MNARQVEMFAPAMRLVTTKGRPKTELLVFRAIVAAGAGGLTVDEVERVTHLRHQSASARVHDLARKLFIRFKRDENGLPVFRPTSSGRRAHVYVEGRPYG